MIYLASISLLSYLLMLITIVILASVGYDIREIDSQSIFWIYIQCLLAGYTLRKLKGYMQ